MAWLKLDDQIFYNRKVAQCDTETKMLYIVGLTYCANQLTDGFIPEATLPLLAGMAGIDWQIAKQSASKLLDVCLWFATDNGWQIPDYLDYNPSKDQVLHNREVRSEAGKRGGQVKAGKTLANSQQIAKQNPGKSLPPTPTPSPSESEREVRTPPPIDPFPEQGPEYREALRKLDAQWPGGVTGTVQLKLTRIWDQLTNGKASWLDDAIIETVARGGHTPDYALQVLATALRSNKRPGYSQASTARPSRPERDLNALLGITNGNS
jgi:hypothetical protein